MEDPVSAPRTRWRAARTHLTPVADGGALIVGAPAATFRTAPLPDGVDVKLWEKCGCSYAPPDVGGKPVPQKADPAWAEWTEDPPKAEGVAAGKRCLRYALSDPRKKSDGGLLGPNYYGLGHFHSGDARLEAPGFTDFMIWTPLAMPNEVWELKRMGQNPTLPQAHHMTALELAGFTVRTVRPCCLLAGDVDRWLGALSGREPTLSEWASEATPEDQAAARQRAARLAVAGGGAVARLPGANRPPKQRTLAPVADPPGKPVDTAEQGRAAAYLIPMPAGDERCDMGAVADLEGWLRELGFPPFAVPWPMRIVVGERVVVVWVNTGEAGKPGQPRPRTWRSSYLDRPFPEHVVEALGGDVVSAPSMPAAMALIEAATPARNLPEETC
jgi:hypothetical protein